MYPIITHILLALVLLPVTPLTAQNSAEFKNYRNHQEVQELLKSLQSSNPQKVALHHIAKSPGGRELTVIEIGAHLTDGPAIFLGANFDGITPLATEGALRLAQYLLDPAQDNGNVKWFILPSGNPDAAQKFFANPRLSSTLNGMEINIDMDDQTSEDGYEDLNKDGYITVMRRKVADGDHRISDEDPRLLVKADRAKGERGIYKVYTEGIDNDGDGLYNEDEPGGINPGINFPHDFQHFSKEAGLWPGYSPETYGVMKFIYDHPEIVMTVNFGEANLLLDLPQEGKIDFDREKIRIPERLARQTGLSAAQTYTMEELVQGLSSRFPDMEITENLVLSQLNLGPEKNFRKNDILLYESLSKTYKEALKAGNISTSRMASEKPRGGSFELWSYFHLGVPSIALSLWEPEVKKDTTAATPGTPPAGKTGAAAQEKKPTTEKQLLDFFDKQQIKGFADWEPFTHPQLGEVEIGGFIPFAGNTPPVELAETLLSSQIPFVASLSKKIPDISIAEEKVTELGAGVYRLEIFVENKGQLPYPTDMGQRNQQPAPIVLILEGKDVKILEGLSRTPIHHLAGNQVRKFSWLVQSEKKTDIAMRLESPVIRNQSGKISLGK
jgi:hypothetical protein